MAGSEIARVHERLDEAIKAIGDLTTTVQTNIELCKQCRPKVLGNGKEGFDARLARIETSQIKNGDARLTAVETKLAMGWKGVTLLFSGASAAGALAGAVVGAVVAIWK